MREQWKPIPESKLEVSTLGNVRNRHGRVLRGTALPAGYRMVGVGKSMKLVHRLVAEAFIPNPKNKPQVNHRNGDKGDNRRINLEWATAAENQRHAERTGLKRVRGENNCNARLTERRVRRIREMVEEGQSIQVVAGRFGVSRASIHDIIAGRTWTHVIGKGDSPEKYARRHKHRGNPKGLLTPAQVREMRAIYDRREAGPKELGEMFGVSIHVAFLVVKRKTYKSV